MNKKLIEQLDGAKQRHFNNPVLKRLFAGCKQAVFNNELMKVSLEKIVNLDSIQETKKIAKDVLKKIED